jgi:hypothetical protein
LSLIFATSIHISSKLGHRMCQQEEADTSIGSPVVASDHSLRVSRLTFTRVDKLFVSIEDVAYVLLMSARSVSLSALLTLMQSSCNGRYLHWSASAKFVRYLNRLGEKVQAFSAIGPSPIPCFAASDDRMAHLLKKFWCWRTISRRLLHRSRPLRFSVPCA